MKLLIANRGEIAVRIIRAAKEMNIPTVAVFSEADRESLHVRLADEAYCIGPNPSKDSYLNIPNILSVACAVDATMIHPGYGFLAENAEFAEMSEACGIQFVGPSSYAIRKMGIKDEAKRTMIESGVPVVPGSSGVVTDDEAIELAREIGYPVIIKATAGGGGRGIRVAFDEEELIKGLVATRKEAKQAFGNGDVYLEKYIESFRHVEVQVLADQYGNVIHLGERDCTIQRRMQKLIEEAPSPAIDEATRQAMGEAAVKAAKAIQYSSAGTIEFIYVPESNEFYFMEMNTRIQVEHPVTEMITGFDLVQAQLEVALGHPLAISQADIVFSGHSIECRINAEDPFTDFRPMAGKIDQYIVPGGMGVRVDSGLFAGAVIPPFYDSMVAKLIVHAPTREEAIAKMLRALDEFTVSGIHTTIPFHQQVMAHEHFRNGAFDTKFVEKEMILTK
ncbi:MULTISPECIES: acetyl-CoA carboxylase biotin carboxylase subunit [unclassified Exiguobacterium]|uniref:acetyl-CoA carboxylase biotin carboxylase subunit n=1 Tax=unclassified Exiguobacterium TaxID=2644629 RepID=UPI00103A920F|nr:MULTISPECIES: acetyl-CoA carboxylase biotin carboxylase subunit [unclassified Exiguobacterium]TCI47665.1 acetyl-CoA carboxylase biotin carboxylase subunit [Exiguobacterium sp. SH5S32]TCI54551.1 acetyl-CoA carboxylase biotin carboxylase subunit [Exiguobacterium sp. SH1S4]TCI61401.1 acetyl-CoA carboxylase biotin carboxylase subunit [Exiguobacterium sp. SH0S2]TCI74345.1 acetyl-CoA carboxylase biotin carboxylase subunit [Exiguobacterium sp. SH1S1]TCI80636.1 acetyl-CoA carboxylase biotin carboxy